MNKIQFGHVTYCITPLPDTVNSVQYSLLLKDRLANWHYKNWI